MIRGRSEAALAVPGIAGPRFPAVRRVADFVRRKPLGAVGGCIVLALVGLAATAELIAPYDPTAVGLAGAGRGGLIAPNERFLFGTDDLGRDIFSRIVFGARVSIVVGVSSTVLGMSVGGLWGIVSGYVGGRMDLITQRLLDVLMAIPGLVMALAMVAVLGPSMRNVIFAIAISMVPSAARVARGSTLTVKENVYIEASRALGCRSARTLVRHLLPNITAPLIIVATADLGRAILSEASLSFLGVGTPPPDPSWGGMLSGSGRSYMEIAPWTAIFPGLAISAVVFGFNLLGDALRDVWDPRLRGT